MGVGNMSKTAIRTAQKSKDATENKRRQLEKDEKRKIRDMAIREVNTRYNAEISRINDLRKDELSKIWKNWTEL